MTDYMAQPVLSLPPSSRQDIVSALLHDYGTSFEDDESSPYKMSPAPAFKELPPPPPSERTRDRKYSNDKPLPAVEKMNMPFQLRVDEPASPDSPNGSISSDGSSARIVSKRLNRRSVPRSLTLTKSNGSTAELSSVPTIAPELEAQSSSKEQATAEKSLPPPPPDKSERRQQQPAMGNQSSKARSPRKDSLHSQDGKDDAMEPAKRKPVPKFTSLAELGNGPRGGKGGPLPRPRASKQSVEEKSDEDRGRAVMRHDVHSTNRENAPSKLKDQIDPMVAPPILNPLPPTPQDEAAAAPPPPTKKPFAGMGLPSNPKHKKGKSSTGFDFLKSATSPVVQQPQQQLPAPNAITPGPTPSPNRIQQMRQEDIVEIVDPPREYPAASPVSNTPRRPFSFEPPVSTLPPLKESLSNTNEDQNTTAGTASPSASAVLLIDTTVPTPQPIHFPPRSASRAPPPPAFASLPSQQRSGMSDAMDSAPESPPTPPFVPLTETPVPRAAVPITEKHHNCYSKHATFVWSRNDFQPMACMICNKNDQERKWACAWCYLRICADCSIELQKTPGRNLQTVLQKRAVEATYGGEEYREDDEDGEEGMHPGFDGSVNGSRVDFS